MKRHDAKRIHTSFFQRLRAHERLQCLHPAFFFSDKDVGQLEAIQSAFNITPSLCLWHMFRAIKKKIAALRKDGEIRIPPWSGKIVSHARS